MQRVITVIDLNAGQPNLGLAAICDQIRSRGGRALVVDLRQSARLPSTLGRAVVLTGGPGSPCVSTPWRRRLQAAVPAMAARVPMLGICLGFQVMASVWGWRLGTMPGPRFGIYRLTLGTRPDRWLRPLPAGAAVFEQRRWGVWPASCAAGRLLATSPVGDALAIRFSPLAIGMVFHPEAAAAPVANWLSHDPEARAKAARVRGPGAADRQAALASRLSDTFDTVLPAFLDAAMARGLA